MSWHFSRALVEAYSEANFLDGELSAPLSESPTPQAYLCKDRMTAFSTRSLSGMTFVPLTESLGEGLLMWFLVGFPARTSASEMPTEQVLMESEADYGLKWQESFARYSHASSSWKIRQQLLLGGLADYSETWPEWGMTHDGECWALKTPVVIMQGDGSGVLPTPCASDYKGGTDKPQKRNGEQRTHQFKHWCKILHGLTYPIPMHMEATMGWPQEWSALKPLATDKFQQWLRLHGVSCQDSS